MVPLFLFVMHASSQAADLRSAAVPLRPDVVSTPDADLQALSTQFKKANIVGMGEPTHGSREVFQTKDRFFRYLVEKCGYSVFALEASMPDCVALDRYVLTGEGDAKAALKAQGFWTWSTQEVLELVEWMRQYNAEPSHTQKLRIVGVDMQNRDSAMLYLQHEFQAVGLPLPDSWLTGTEQNWSELQESHFNPAPPELLTAIEQKWGPSRSQLAERIGQVFLQANQNQRATEVMSEAQQVPQDIKKWVYTGGTFLQKHPEAPAKVREAIESLSKPESENVTDPSATSKRMAEFTTALESYSKGLKGEDQKAVSGAASLFRYLSDVLALGPYTTSFRDKCMADNLQWVASQYFKGQKVMLWAHNYHVARHPNNMGGYLAKAMGDAYYPVGFAFHEGAFQAKSADGTLKEFKVGAAQNGSLEGMLAEAKLPAYFIDFSGMTPELKGKFGKLMLTRNVGAVFNPSLANGYWGSIVPSVTYSGMIYLHSTTRARPLP